jgi:molybdenum cofactor cytidylyltransferase
VVAAIVLAAGGSSRMGRPKALLPIATGTVLSTVVERTLRGGVDRVVVVLGHEAEAVGAGAGLPRDPRLRIVVNAGWADGLSSSLAAGLGECLEADAALVVLGDQPGLEPATIGRLMEAWRKGAPIAAVGRERRVAHPVLFDRSLFAELRALRGDMGAREILRARAGDVVRVPGAALRDLDTPSDYDSFVSDGPATTDEGLDLP